MSYIVIDKVVKRYKDKLAVDSVNLSINKGRIYGLLGPNGAGKSTLISMLCGILPMSAGDIRVDGHSVGHSPLEVKKRLGYVPQEIALFEDLSIADNLNYFARMYRLDKQSRTASINKYLDVLGLSSRQNDKVSKLSGGLKRRANIGCALLHIPELLIMDEPTVGIDPQSRNHILEFIKDLNSSSGTTVIYTSHYMEEIQYLCHDIAIMDNGRILVEGSKEEVLTTFTNEMTINIIALNLTDQVLAKLRHLPVVKNLTCEFKHIKLVAHSAQTSLNEVIQCLTESGVFIENIEVETPNLDAIFLSITGKTLRD